MNVSNITLLGLLLLLIPGCGKKVDEHVPQMQPLTLAEKVAAEEMDKGCLNYPLDPAASEDKNVSKAILLCQKAAEQGDVYAQQALGEIFYNVRKDYKESAKWFRLAAEQGHPRSQLILGIIYSKGEGVPKDLVSAYMWTIIASRVIGNVPKKDLDKAQKLEFAKNDEFLRKTFAEFIDSYEKQMTASQIAEAKKLADWCTARKFKWC